METVKLLVVVDHVHLECRLARCVQVVDRLLAAVSEESLAAAALPRTRWVAAAGRLHGSRTLVLALQLTVEVPLTVAPAVSAVPHPTEVRQAMVAAPVTAAVQVTAVEEAHGVAA